jgi:enoyl-CoA hydratase/carnithine racemase
MIEVETTAEGAIRVLTLNRPPVNALTLDGVEQLKEIVADCDRDGRVRAIVVTGWGPRFFSAGAELSLFSSADAGKARAAAKAFSESFQALQHAHAVVIAAINGHAMGGGLECALSCDVRIAESHALLALPEASVGLLPAATGTQTLPWLVGEGWAKRLILTGERIGAETALRIGLVEEMVESGAALDTALEMARRVLKQSPDAVRAIKELIHLARHGVPRAAALDIERERFIGLFEGPNQREGVNAFLAKREPVWS